MKTLQINIMCDKIILFYKKKKLSSNSILLRAVKLNGN